ncbi:MAG: calcium/proton exchanger [Chloroflexi bacterium]|nr:MAG: calcium/proton exchanger [Chloroflexota bacterium]
MDAAIKFVRGNPVLALIIFAPLAVIIELSGGDEVLVFALAALGLIPLADLIGESTEELAVYTGPRIGGLLNATLGNAAELIITVFAIERGLLELVRASIIGSILGNLLLVLGLSLLLGGWKNGIQKFDRRNAAMNATLLIMVLVTLMVPTLFDIGLQEDPIAEERLSEGVSVVMIVLYGLMLYYSFRSRPDGATIAHHDTAAHHEARWSMGTAGAILVAATLGVVIMSEVLVGAVEAVTVELGLTEFFIGIIIIPLVGNVAEHLVAVQAAIKNRMELSLAVSLGSSLQIALFVAPVLVFISLLFGETLLLVFNTFELVALAAASLVAAFIAQDGESNWLEGAVLLAVYIIVALGFFYLPGGEEHLGEAAEALEMIVFRLPF